MRLIDADALIEAIEMDDKASLVSAIWALSIIDEAPTIPTVETQRKKGRWKGKGLGDYRCSLCGEVTRHTRTNFCPWCGAEMVKGAEDD